MPKIKIYHVRTLFWTYLVWAGLGLWLVLSICVRTSSDCLFISVPRVWGMMHIAPLLPVIPCANIGGGTSMLIFSIVVAMVAGSLVVAGLLLDRRWARFLIIMGISVWFLAAFLIMGTYV